MRPNAWLPTASACLLVLASALYAGVPGVELHGVGRVAAVDWSRGWITVEHGPIGQLFVAGQTDFPVEARDLLERIRVDDRVAFSLTTPSEGHGELSISNIEVLGREPRDTPGTGITARDVGMALLVSLLVAVIGLLGLQTRQLRRLIRGSDATVGSLREQLRLQREMSANVEKASAALLPVLRVYQSELRRIGEQVQVALSATPRDEPVGSHDTTRPIVIVRRGETETFRVLDERLGKPGLARVVWDRRRRERRSTTRLPESERRRRERRGPMSVTWQGLGYLLAQPKARRLNVVA